MGEAATTAPVFVRVDRLRVRFDKATGKICMWNEVVGAETTHETLMEIDVAADGLDEYAAAMAEAALWTGSRAA